MIYLIFLNLYNHLKYIEYYKENINILIRIKKNQLMKYNQIN